MKLQGIPDYVLRLAGALGGDRVAFSYLFKRLKNEGATPETVIELVHNNLPLFDSKEIEWTEWQDLFRKTGLTDCLTKERFEKEFEKSMPDVCKAVREEPNGRDWFNAQVTELRIKLGIELPPGSFHKIESTIDE